LGKTLPIAPNVQGQLAVSTGQGSVLDTKHVGGGIWRRAGSEVV